MDYPENFDTQAFPAGKRIAVSRFVGICTMVSLFLILVSCVTLLWIIKSQKINPTLIYVVPNQGIWETVGKTHEKCQIEYYHSLQQSLVSIFTEKWFTISADVNKNNDLWGACEKRSLGCAGRTLSQEPKCEIYCMTNDAMYNKFIHDVLPMYQSNVLMGQRWVPNIKTISAKPNGTITKDGGIWVVTAVVQSNLNGHFRILGYATVKRDTLRYPKTLGYYISDFNSYRIADKK
ncbi:MAG: hypothetical protein K5912_00785 [Alphaproteobacteria bacterium]|nr:hypothetical protein [Alphaproteobacteria bacterium]